MTASLARIAGLFFYIIILVTWIVKHETSELATSVHFLSNHAVQCNALDSKIDRRRASRVVVRGVPMLVILDDAKWRSQEPGRQVWYGGKSAVEKMGTKPRS